MKYKVGQIYFTNGEGIFPSLIRFYNRANFGERGWSHAGIVTKVTKDKVNIHEALAQGFVESTYTKDDLENKIREGICAFRDVDHRLTNVKKHADNYLGRGYGFTDIFGIATSFLFGWRFLKVTGASRLICSEAVSRILYDASNKRVNLEEEWDKPYDLICPQEIWLSEHMKDEC